MNIEKNFTRVETKRRFKEECKVINLKYEYRGYTGEERYAIISELSKEELWEKYSEIIQDYVPFVLLSVAQGQVIEEFDRNEDKFQKRQTRNKDILSFASDETERLHARLIEEDFVEVLERKETWFAENRLLNEALDLLTPVQRRRIIKHCVQGKTLRAIAQEEGICFGVVDRSVHAGLKKMKRYFELSKVG